MPAHHAHRTAHRAGSSTLARVAAAALLGLGLMAQAQTVPDAGSLLRQIEQQRPQPLPPSLPPIRPAAPPPMQALDQASVTVQRFEFAGNKLLGAQQLAPAVAGFLRRPLSFAELQNAAIAVANAYRQAGWVVRAYLPRQEITGGVVTIQIVEAVFGAVRQQGQAQRVSADKLRRVVEAAQRPGAPVNGDALDRALLLIDDLPGVSATGRLAEGQNDSETDLALAVSDGPLLSGDAAADNTGSRSTGANRLSLNVALNSPARLADQANVNLLHTSGSSYARAAYSLPLGDRGWRLGANLSQLSYKLRTPEFAALDAHGSSSTAGAEASYPLLRSRLKNLYLALNVDHKSFDNLSGGVTATRYSTSAATLGLNGNVFDEVEGGGVSGANLAFTQGRVNLAGSPNEASDAASLRTGGSFGKLRYGASRQQVLPADFSLYASLSGQLASKNLDSSEKFYLGGASGVRAYPSSEGGGSQGQLLTIELRRRIGQQFNLGAFFDTGSVTVNKKNDIAGAAALNSYTLKGLGASLAWTGPAGLNLKVTLARRVGDNPNPTSTGRDQDGSLVKNRLWLQASLPF